MKEFLKKLRDGGKIVSSSDLSELEIAQARACDRFYIDDDNFGFAYFPKV